MSRRRHEARRLALAGLPLAGGALAWQHAGQPEHLAGMTVACALALLAGPPLLLVLVTAPGALLMGAVPVSWRIAYFRSHARKAVPRKFARAVRAADRGRCLACQRGMPVPDWVQETGKAGVMNIDHVRPRASGGCLTIWNSRLLCWYHNRVKSNYWRDRDGYVHYRPFPRCDDVAQAAQILALERRARWNLMRYWRAAWSLA